VVAVQLYRIDKKPNHPRQARLKFTQGCESRSCICRRYQQEPPKTVSQARASILAQKFVDSADLPVVVGEARSHVSFSRSHLVGGLL